MRIHIALGPGPENSCPGRVVLASYLGSILRYDVETAAGQLLKVDVRDPWHHEVLAPGAPVTLSFPSSTALTLADD